MSEEAETTYYVKVEIGRHVPQDQGFYVIWSYKEMINGVEGLKKAIAIGFNSLANYMERRLVVNDVSN